MTLTTALSPVIFFYFPPRLLAACHQCTYWGKPIGTPRLAVVRFDTMWRSRVCLSGFTMKYVKGTGLWDEDHVNDFDASRYLSARSTMRWYYGMERLQTRKTMNARRATQSYNNNNGLHHSGRGAFERELERRGIQVDKYPLTTTTGATRVAEMVVLLRRELEAQAATAMAAQRQAQRRDAPSEWYDEADGPLNPRFLASMQHNYTAVITDLPNDPITRGMRGRT